MFKFCSMDKLIISGYIGQRDEALDKMLGEAGVGENFTADMMRAYLKEKAADSEINIEVDSIGGDVVEGFEIYDLLQAEKKAGKTINTYGKAFDSIASVIFLAGDNRKVYAGAKPLIHNSWLSPEMLGDVQLNKETLREIADSNEEADYQILSEYLKVSGRDKMRMLQDFMRNETQLTDAQLLELNFATEIIGAAAPTKKAKALAFNSRIINNQNLTINSIQMAEEAQNEKLNGLEKGLNKLFAFLKGNAKNMVLPLAGGETQLYIFSEDGEIEGKKAVIADDGEPTDELAPAGEHSLNDGRKIVVGEGGIIESVSEAQAMYGEEEMKAALAQKEEEMKAMSEEKEKALQAAKSEMENLKKEFATQLQALKAQVDELREVVPGDEPQKNALESLKAMREMKENLKPSERRLIALKNQLTKN